MFLSVTAHAEVHSRWGSGGPSDFKQQFGWPKAYSTEMKINQGKARVEVFSADKSLDQALAKLQAHFDRITPSAVFFPGENMAWGIAYHKRMVTRFLLVNNPQKGDTLVYKIEQKESEFNKSRPKNQGHLLSKVPHYPGSTPTYYNYDEGTRTGLEISRSRAPAETISRQLASQLESKGWKRGASKSAGMSVFLKGRDMVYVGVSESEGESVVTRVHKKGTK